MDLVEEIKKLESIKEQFYEVVFKDLVKVSHWVSKINEMNNRNEDIKEELSKLYYDILRTSDESVRKITDNYGLIIQ